MGRERERGGEGERGVSVLEGIIVKCKSPFTQLALFYNLPTQVSGWKLFPWCEMISGLLF